MADKLNTSMENWWNDIKKKGKYKYSKKNLSQCHSCPPQIAQEWRGFEAGAVRVSTMAIGHDT